MTTTTDQPARRRERPYLLWLEQSRDAWKARAVSSRAEANALRRKARHLTHGRDHWKAQTLALRRRLAATSPVPAAPQK